MKYIKKFEAKKEESLIFKFPKKRIHRETDKSYIILTRGYSGSFFTIPKSQVKSFEEDGIKVNDKYTEPVVKMELKPFIWNKIKSDVKRIDGIIFESVDVPKMEEWPKRQYRDHEQRLISSSDHYFTYDLDEHERQKYLNKWFIGNFVKVNNKIRQEEVVTLKETDETTTRYLYDRKHNQMSITITKDYENEHLYNMKAMVHSIDDSSFGIWWHLLPLEELRETRKKLMDWINPPLVDPSTYRFLPINGEDFLNYCISLGADENSKDYN